MKKFISGAIVLILLLQLVSCSKKVSPDTVNVYVMRGVTAMGMVKLMKDSDESKSEGKYNFDIMTIDEIVPKIAQGAADIAAIPANMAAVLYQNTEKNIQVAVINTLGVLYILEKGEGVNSIADLKGKTIYATGKGAVPEYTLRTLLKENGIDPDADVTMEFKSEPAEAISSFAVSGDADSVVMLPQPFVTSAQKSQSGLRAALDLTAEWDKLGADFGALITGVVIVNKTFAEKYPDSVKTFLDEYEKSAEYANQNNDETAELVGEYGIVSAEIAKEALPYCGIAFITGNEMKEKLNKYLATLYEQNPQSVGGSLPDEEFFRIK